MWEENLRNGSPLSAISRTRSSPHNALLCAQILQDGVSREEQVPGLAERNWDDTHVSNTVLDVHADYPACGYRLITDQLIHTMAFRVGEPACDSCAPYRASPQAM